MGSKAECPQQTWEGLVPKMADYTDRQHHKALLDAIEALDKAIHHKATLRGAVRALDLMGAWKQVDDLTGLQGQRDSLRRILEHSRSHIKPDHYVPPSRRDDAQPSTR